MLFVRRIQHNHNTIRTGIMNLNFCSHDMSNANPTERRRTERKVRMGMCLGEQVSRAQQSKDTPHQRTSSWGHV